GLITYMRTDSTHLSGDAIQMARSFIKNEFGDRYLPEKPNFYASSNKSAQEAHEAIRPTDATYTPAAARAKLGAERSIDRSPTLQHRMRSEQEGARRLLVLPHPQSMGPDAGHPCQAIALADGQTGLRIALASREGCSWDEPVPELCIGRCDRPREAVDRFNGQARFDRRDELKGSGPVASGPQAEHVGDDVGFGKHGRPRLSDEM
ncbi:MAG: DNA topoisomerase I, partial [uncultured Microvirga sp.]